MTPQDIPGQLAKPPSKPPATPPTKPTPKLLAALAASLLCALLAVGCSNSSSPVRDHGTQNSQQDANSNGELPNESTQDANSNEEPPNETPQDPNSNEEPPSETPQAPNSNEEPPNETPQAPNSNEEPPNETPQDPDNPQDSSTPAQAKALQNLAADIIIPAYQQLQASAHQLNITLLNLCPPVGVPTSEGMAQAQDFLADALRNWSYVEAMQVGPVENRQSWNYIDQPINTGNIENLIAGNIPGEPFALDQENLTHKVDSDQRGLRAIEYMLGDPNNPTVAFGNLDDPNRCNYVTSVASIIATELDQILALWQTGTDAEPPYREAIGQSATAELGRPGRGCLATAGSHD